MPEIKLQKRAVYAVDVYHALLEVGWKIKPTLRFVQGLPKTDVAPVRHGHWMYCYEEGIATCSECGNTVYEDYAGRFCGYCGARMDLGGAENV